MAHKTTRHADAETGVTTSRTTFDVSKGLAGSEQEMLREQLRHTVRGNTSLDYVIGDIEGELRSGVWRPEKGDEILAAIDHLRHVVTHPDFPAETIAVAGVRVGRLITAATAKDYWPIVRHGRTFRRVQSKKGSRRGKQKADQAAEHDPLILLYSDKWDRGDHLQIWYPIKVTCIREMLVKRHEVSLSTKQIRARLKSLRLKPG